MFKNMKTKTKTVFMPLFCPVVTTIAIFCSASPLVMAETDTWTGGGDGVSWNQAANWSDANNAAPVNGDSLIFGSAAGSTLNDNLGFTLTTYGISFTTGGYTLANTFDHSGIFLSGQSVGNYTGIYNEYGSSFDTVNLNLSLDWGYYSMVDFSGSGMALNGALTLNKGAVAYFYGEGNITSTSLVNDSSGLISGLGGAGLMFNGAQSPFTAAAPTSLAAVSGGDIVPYTAWPSVISSPGAIGATTAAGAVNIELTGTSAGNYTLANGTGITYANTIFLANASAADLVIASTAGAQTLDLGAVSGIGGIYLPAGNTAQAVTVGSGAQTILTAGPETGPATPGTIVYCINGTTSANQCENNATIKDNLSGGSVTVIKTGTGTMYTGGTLTNSYSGGTYVLQGQLQGGLPLGSFGTGPIYVASNATVYFNNGGTVTNPLYLSPGLGAPDSATIESAGTAGALAIGSSNAYTFTGTMNLLGSPVTAAPGCRIGSASTPTVTITGQITGTGTLEFFSAHSGTVTLSNPNTSGPKANNWQGGVIIDPPPGHAVNEDLKMGLNNQIPSGPNAGNIMLTPAETTVYSRFDLNGTIQSINGLIGTASTTGTTSNQLGNFVASNASLTLGNNNATAAFVGYAIDDGTMSITKVGTGTQTFTSVSTGYSFPYNGNTTISNGTLQLTEYAAIPNTPLITIAAGAALDASQLYSGGLTLGAAQTLNCVGTVLGNTTVNGTIKSLDAIGTLNNNGNLTLDGGSTFVLDMDNATGTAGADPGWTMLNVSGTLVINASSSQINLNVTSLSTNDAAGNAVNFNSGESYSWVIAQAGGISGFTGTAQFNIITSAFANHPNSSAQWSVTQNGSQLMLNFNGFQTITTPVTPASETVNQDKNATFTVTANSLGSGTTFTWYQDGNQLSNGGQSAGGAPGNVVINTVGNTSTLTINGVDSAVEDEDSGIISVTVDTTYNGPQSAESSAVLDVIDFPYNLNVTSSQTVTPVTAGAVNMLTASASGTAPFTYQWYLNNTLIAGATSSNFNVNVSPSTIGNYTVVIGNAAGDVTNSAVEVTGPVSLVPNQILFEPFNYPDQTHPDGGWDALTITNVFNQATGVAVGWVNAAAQDVTTLPSYNVSDQYAPPRSLLGDQYPVEGLAGNDPNTIYLDSDTGAGPVNLPFGTGGGISSGTVYFSAVVEIWGFNPNPTTTPDYFCGLGTGAANSSSHSVNIFILPNEAGGDGAFPNIPYQFGVFKGNITSTSQLATGAGGNGAWDPNQSLDYAIYFVVCRLNINANGAGYSTCDLWVNPSPSTFYTSEANVPTPDVQGVGGSVADEPGAISLFYMRDTTYPVDRLVSDVRVGTTWASVTPPSAPALSLPNQLLTNAVSSTVIFASQNAGNAANSYQWTFNNGSGPATLSDGTLPDNAVISGSSTGTMTITGATAAEVGTYTVTGSNSDPAPSAGGATLTGSASAILTRTKPSLSISTSSANVTISWPTNWAVALESTTSLQQPITWTPVTGGGSGFLYWPPETGALTWAPIAANGTNYTVTLPATSKDLFFQLVPSP